MRDKTDIGIKGIGNRRCGMGQVNEDGYLKEQMGNEDMSFPFGIYLYDRENRLYHTLECHWHEAMEFGLVLEGKVEYYVNQMCISLEKGDVIFLNSDTLHIMRQAGDKAKIAVFMFHYSLFSQEVIYQKYFKNIREGQIQGILIERENIWGDRIRHKLEGLYHLDKQEGYEFQVLCQMGELWLYTLSYLEQQEQDVIKGSRMSRVQEEIVKRMIAYIHSNYREKISVEDMADHVQVSRSGCFRTFKHFTGETPMEYVNEYRLIQSTVLLRENALTIAQIGSICGFSTPSYFGKVFRAKYGMTPLEYRSR